MSTSQIENMEVVVMDIKPTGMSYPTKGATFIITTVENLAGAKG